MEKIYDYVIIGSGFGGAVSALRLSEKGYKVLVIEKGKWFKEKDFPKTNWNLKKWLWIPTLKMFGFFKMTLFRHVTVLSGVGVGGGSLVYAATLPVPKKPFFESSSWSHLANWEKELKRHYATAQKMLGTTKAPYLFDGDKVLKELATDLKRPDEFQKTNVGIYFGTAGKISNDPYFKGRGPSRKGCQYCGACMIGCPHNAKNTLDKNYLYLAERAGAHIWAEKEVYDVKENIKANDRNGNYTVFFKNSLKYFPKKESVTTKGIVFAGGVLGTIKLLWALKQNGSMPRISNRLGYGVRTNSESLLGVTTTRRDLDFSKGIAIGSIYNVDEHSHLEVVRYPDGSGFFRLAMVPAVLGSNFLLRISRIIIQYLKNPIQRLRAYFVPNWAKYTQIMLFMQSIDSTMRLVKGRFRLKTRMAEGPMPTSDIPEAHAIAQKFANKVKGSVHALASEGITGLASTAHILGGCCMGENTKNGVIDSRNRLFGYSNVYVCDGSMISANIGVNPSLTITALTERAMSFIPRKNNKKKQKTQKKKSASKKTLEKK